MKLPITMKKKNIPLPLEDMKLLNIRNLFNFSVVAILIGLIVVGISHNAVGNTRTPVPVSYVEGEYVADFSDDRALVGASHDIFVAKVLSQTGTKDLGSGPETQFEVQIIDTIKGSLTGTVTVDQIGGYRGDTLIMAGNEEPHTDVSTYLLKPGSTYVLATRYNPAENWYTLNPYPTARALISSDPNDSTEHLIAFAESNTRFRALLTAYPNEILLKEDVVRNNTPNSYKSVSPLRTDAETIVPTMSVAQTTNNSTSTEATSSQPIGSSQ